MDLVRAVFAVSPFAYIRRVSGQQGYRPWPMPIEFEFTATPELGNEALRYLLWRRGGPIGPIAIILFPIVLAIIAADPTMRPVAYIAGGAAIMLFIIFCWRWGSVAESGGGFSNRRLIILSASRSTIRASR